MNYDYRHLIGITLTEKTKNIFTNPKTMGLYSPFQVLCNWLYGTKYSYGNRKGDVLFKGNTIVMTEEHVEKIIEEKIFRAVDPKKYNEDTLRSMLREWIGLKVWAN